MILEVLSWIVVGGLIWVGVALGVGVVIGRVVRNRDRQVPRDSREEVRR
jgi:hypothetical protein